MTDPIAERTKLYGTATERARRDGDFRGRLIADPRATLDALAEELKLAARAPALPIEIVDGTYDRLVLVLPPLEETPLSDTDLEKVTGGASLSDATRVNPDAHGCQACPHVIVGPLFRTS